MKQVFVFLLALMMCGAAMAQADRTGKAGSPATDTNEIFVVVEHDPEFPGGMDALYQWIGANYKWPASARDCDAFGNVYVTFIIEKDGSVSNIKLLRDIGCGHGEAVVEMVGTIHHGENRGTKPVILYMFYLSQEGQELAVQHPEIPLE